MISAFIPLRSKLTSDAEKESVMMFGRNLRQLLLTSPVRGRTLMGVDPGYKHGCKLAIISPTSEFQYQFLLLLVLEGLLKTCIQLQERVVSKSYEPRSKSNASYSFMLAHGIRWVIVI